MFSFFAFLLLPSKSESDFIAFSKHYESGYVCLSKCKYVHAQMKIYVVDFCVNCALFQTPLTRSFASTPAEDAAACRYILTYKLTQMDVEKVSEMFRKIK